MPVALIFTVMVYQVSYQYSICASLFASANSKHTSYYQPSLSLWVSLITCTLHGIILACWALLALRWVHARRLAWFRVAAQAQL